MSDATRCACCGEPAEFLCDHVIGWSARIDESARVPRLVKKDAYTCDAPLCGEHRVRVGTTHVCGPRGCEHDTRDKCPLHSGKLDGGAPLLSAGFEGDERLTIQRELRLRGGVVEGGK